jgi:hypothetical protein
VAFTDGRGVGRGAKSYDREKAWPSLNHSILSELEHFLPGIKIQEHHVLCSSAKQSKNGKPVVLLKQNSFRNYKKVVDFYH